MAKTVTQAKKAYQGSDAVKDFNYWKNATIDQLGAKYGFDFSKAYAQRQAETEAQAKRNAYNASIRENQTLNKQNIGSIDDNLREGVIGSERNYFQNYLQQRQQQSNRGLNAGIAADQDLRLQMNQQHEMGGMYRDAQRGRIAENDRHSNESLRLAEALALVEQQRISQGESLYQDRRMQGFGLLGQERDWRHGLERDAYGSMQDNIGDIRSQEQFAFEQRKFNEQMALQQAQFNFQKQQAAAAKAAQAAAQRSAASRATSSRSSSSSARSGGSTSPVAKAAAAFKQANKPSTTTALDKYYQAEEKKRSKGVPMIYKTPPSTQYFPIKPPAQNKNMTAWEKMQIFGR